jgi:pyrroline-5-carboxylate reductase
MRIAFIGAGNMATALMGGLIAQGVEPRRILAVDPDAEKREACAQQLGVGVCAKLGAEAGEFDALVLSVKPQVLSEACGLLFPLLDRQLVISIAAGVLMADISRWLGGYSKIVRAMPNTPALIGKGVAGLYAAPNVDESARDLASQVLRAVGSAIWFDDEKQLDAVTAISGSGPAYVFYFMEALQEAGVRAGLNGAQAKTLALETFIGATQLARQSGEPPDVLRERVTSKGGTTAAALSWFDASRIKDEIVRGVLSAQARSVEIGRELGSDGTQSK